MTWPTDQPRVLVAYPFLTPSLMEGDVGFRDWLLDSGAYSALNSGVEIDLEQFTQDALKLQKNDKRLAGVFALDVIGDAETTIHNADEMKKAGVNVIPTWHAGTSIDNLRYLKKNYTRIAVGGLVMRLANNRALKMSQRNRRRTLEIAFSELWPHWIHGFGCTRDDLLDAFPFASVDSTTWRLNPGMYGGWKRYGRLPVRLNTSSLHWLKTEALWFMEREARLSARWARELSLIGESRMNIALACAKPDLQLINSFFASSPQDGK